MNHFIYTLDVATARELSSEEQYDLRMAIDKLLAEWPLEFEDWRTEWRTENRKI